MATYPVEPDNYAGWNPTGRNFAMAGAAVGVIGLLSWMSLHRHLGTFRPDAASDQVFLLGLVWFGAGGFVLMAFAASGSILLSRKSRGIVNITAAGVIRTVDARTRSLPWSDIQGLVPMPYGGVTLVAATGKLDIVIPRFLEDYRACIAELKDHGVQVLPPSTLRRKRRETSWLDKLQVIGCVLFFTFATSSHEPHIVRIASFGCLVALAVWIIKSDWKKAELGTPRWFGCVMFLGILLCGFCRMLFTW